MFDSHYHVIQRVHETKTVHEHRAPTDESVRLLREMEQAARDKVLQAIRLENSPIDGVVHVQRDAMSDRIDYCIFVKINGERLEVRKSFDGLTEPAAIADGLLTALSERIASKVLASTFAKLPAHLRRLGP